jgi:hypothetical protein
MPKPANQWFKPNSDECPSCLLVLNQLTCYFPHGTEKALLDAKYSPGNIPKNSTHRHRLLDQNVYTDATLPSSIHDSKLISSLRKRPDLLLSMRSDSLNYYVEDDRLRALKRAQKYANSSLPLGLLISSEKPSLEDRFTNAILAFNDRLDKLSPSGINSTTYVQNEHSSTPSYDVSNDLTDIKSQLKKLHTLETSVPTKAAMLLEMTEQLSKVEQSISSQLDQIRRDQAETHRSTMRYLEGKLSELDNKITRLHINRASRASTPRPSPRPSFSTPKTDTQSQAEIPTAKRLQSPDNSSAHARQASSSSLNQRAPLMPPPARPAPVPIPGRIEAEQALYDDDSDNDSISSRQTAITTMTTTTMASSKSTSPTDRTPSSDRNVWSCSDTNIRNWISYLHENSHSFKHANRSNDSSSALTDNLFEKYILEPSVTPDFQKKVKEAMISEIRQVRDSRRHSNSKSKPSHSDRKPSSLWPAKKK